MRKRVFVILKMFLFLAFFLAILLAAHGLFYGALVRLFAVRSPLVKTALRMGVSVLSVSFFVAFFLLHWRENAWTIGFYIFSAVWIGLLINLLLGAGMSAVILGVLQSAGLRPQPKAVSSVCLLLAVLFTGYGMWNAFSPKVKDIEIEIADLPDSWHNKTLVQLSDMHLGHIHGCAFLSRVAWKVNSLEPDIVAITGDLFDGKTADVSHIAGLLDQIRAKKSVFFVTGNHEGYIGVGHVLAALKKTTLIILQNEAVVIDGLRIIGVAYPGIAGREKIRNLAATADVPNRPPTILLFHTPTSAVITQEDTFDRHFNTYWMPDTTFTENRALGVDLQLSGHTHGGQIFPFNLLARSLYRGYHYGLKQINGFYIYTSCGTGTWGPPIRTANRSEIPVFRLKKAAPRAPAS